MISIPFSSKYRHLFFFYDKIGTRKHFNREHTTHQKPYTFSNDDVTINEPTAKLEEANRQEPPDSVDLQKTGYTLRTHKNLDWWGSKRPRIIRSRNHRWWLGCGYMCIANKHVCCEYECVSGLWTQVNKKMSHQTTTVKSTG